MVKPLAICVEDMGSQAKTRYMRCVALPGRQPGLRLDEAGQVVWRSEDDVACELWVSADGRLVLFRPEGAIPVSVHRAGRSLDVPCGKPVFVIDKDEVDVGERRLRIHVHGEAPSVAAPSPLSFKSRPLRHLAQAATAAAIVGTVSALGCSPIEIRNNPPEPVMPTDTPTIVVRDDPPEIAVTIEASPTPTIEVRDDPPTVTPAPTIEVRDDPPEIALPEIAVSEAIEGEWTASQAYDIEGERVWLTGTLTIEGNAYSFESTQEIEGPSVQGTLDFLFETPDGEIAIEYADGVTPGESFYAYSPGDTLAVCRFLVASEVAGEFLIRVGDSDGLYFHSLSDEVSLWRVTKQVEGY
jgi:hypothetical protein